MNNNMYQNQPPYQSNISYYQQTQSALRQPQVAYQSPVLKGRLVTSFEEAKAASIDFDGSVFYFPDLANKRIYTKQINLDGTASLNMYELKEIPVETPINMETASYITREEFEQALNQIRVDLQSQKETPKMTF